jgi:hypothetical protein
MCLWKALLLSNFKILNLPNEFFGVNIDELAIERRKSVWFISLQRLPFFYEINVSWLVGICLSKFKVLVWVRTLPRRYAD